MPWSGISSISGCWRGNTFANTPMSAHDPSSRLGSRGLREGDANRPRIITRIYSKSVRAVSVEY
eukprot:6504979-Prymnesium_polylepis.1